MSARESRWFVPATLLAVAAFLYVNLFVWPATPFLLGGDQMYFWAFAQRLVHGDQVYRDFLQFTPPGLDLLYSVPVRVFGLRIWLPNAADLVLGVLSAWICFALARRIMDRGGALLATATYVAWIFGKAMNGTHHWYSALAILCGVLVSQRSALAAGACFGIASFFTQTHGAFAAAGYGAFVLWDVRQNHQDWRAAVRPIVWCGGGFALALLILESPYLISIGLERLWYFEMTYPARYIAAHHRTSLLGLDPTWHNLPNIALRVLAGVMLPVVYTLAIARAWRSGQREVMRLAMVGAALFLGVATSPNWIRIYAVCLPGVVLLIWTLPRRARCWIWVFVACLAVQQTIGRQRAPRVIAQLPSGRVAAPPVDYEKLAWLAQHTRPGDLFFQATWPGLYFPMQLTNPTYLSEITTDESTRPEYLERCIVALDARHVRYVLWSPYNDQVEPLSAYVHDHYRRAVAFMDSDEIWERRSGH